MKMDIDELLRHALTPVDEPDKWLNRKILYQVKEERMMTGRKKRRLSMAAMLTAMVLGVSSITVYATWRYLSAAEVAEQVQDTKLAEAFLGEQAFVINEVQCYGDYQVTLLSIVSGEQLSKFNYFKNGALAADRTYAAVAIEQRSGLPDSDNPEFFVSPLIGGYNPALFNIADLSGSYIENTENGILYRLIECDNIEMFADHELYLCASDGGNFYNTAAYQFDDLTGEISRNEEYDGLNALFHLPLDSSMANPEKAAEYMADLNSAYDLAHDFAKEKLHVELSDAFEIKSTEGNEAGAMAAEYALSYVGNPYTWGGESLTEGTDSSGFTKSVYEHFSVNLPHNSRKQCELGIEVGTIENAMPGDLVFYETPAHVAIYIGEGLIVHAIPQDGICVSEVDFDEVLCIRRLLDIK